MENTINLEQFMEEDDKVKSLLRFLEDSVDVGQIDWMVNKLKIRTANDLLQIDEVNYEGVWVEAENWTYDDADQAEENTDEEGIDVYYVSYTDKTGEKHRAGTLDEHQADCFTTLLEGFKEVIEEHPEASDIDLTNIKENRELIKAQLETIINKSLLDKKLDNKATKKSTSIKI